MTSIVGDLRPGDIFDLGPIATGEAFPCVVVEHKTIQSGARLIMTTNYMIPSGMIGNMPSSTNVRVVSKGVQE